ncbi:MAG: hypothetical protein ACJATU_000283, partial [Rickettsiales bacterium]
QDYDDVLEPVLDKIKDENKKIKLLFHAASDFDGYTFGAAWEDCKLGIHHFKTFEKCAIVTDCNWLKNSCRFFSPLIPCPVKIFDDRDLDKSKDWLDSSEQHLTCSIDKKTSLLTIEVGESLSADDFKAVAKIVDPWVEENGQIEGVIIHARRFPYWKNAGGFISHISFIKNHHRDVKKVALVANGAIPAIAQKLTNHFILAEVKNFDYDQMDAAKSWIME